jgi:hypothetical protein
VGRERDVEVVDDDRKEMAEVESAGVDGPPSHEEVEDHTVKDVLDGRMVLGRSLATVEGGTAVVHTPCLAAEM